MLSFQVLECEASVLNPLTLLHRHKGPNLFGRPLNPHRAETECQGKPNGESELCEQYI